MLIKVLPVGIYDANCYIIVDKNTNDAVIMDPGGDINILTEEIDKLGIKPQYILLTHGHVDHVGAVVGLRNRYHIPFYINKKDEKMMENGSMIYGQLPKADGYINNGDVLTFGTKTIKCIETPGHTPGGMCFLIDDSLFTGDTLFRESVGRVDFPGGSHDTLINSVKNNILPLGDNVTVYPGHGTKTSIGHERIRNPFLVGDFYVY